MRFLYMKLMHKKEEGNIFWCYLKKVLETSQLTSFGDYHHYYLLFFFIFLLDHNYFAKALGLKKWLILHIATGINKMMKQNILMRILQFWTRKKDCYCPRWKRTVFSNYMVIEEDITFIIKVLKDDTITPNHCASCF